MSQIRWLVSNRRDSSFKPTSVLIEPNQGLAYTVYIHNFLNYIHINDMPNPNRSMAVSCMANLAQVSLFVKPWIFIDFLFSMPTYLQQYRHLLLDVTCQTPTYKNGSFTSVCLCARACIPTTHTCVCLIRNLRSHISTRARTQTSMTLFYDTGNIAIFNLLKRFIFAQQ